MTPIINFYVVFQLANPYSSISDISNRPNSFCNCWLHISGVQKIFCIHIFTQPISSILIFTANQSAISIQEPQIQPNLFLFKLAFIESSLVTTLGDNLDKELEKVYSQQNGQQVSTKFSIFSRFPWRPAILFITRINTKNRFLGEITTASKEHSPTITEIDRSFCRIVFLLVSRKSPISHNVFLVEQGSILHANMRLLVFLFILLQTTCSVYSEVCESSDTCNKGSNNTDSNSEILNSNSFIHHLVNTAAGIDFDSSRCRHELSLIKEGIREKDLWASKRKLNSLLADSRLTYK